jgi:hypothetical protein
MYDESGMMVDSYYTTRNGTPKEAGHLTRAERDRLIFESHVIEGKSFRQLERDFGLSKTACWNCVRRVTEELSEQFHSKIEHIRVQQTVALQSIIGELRQAWNESNKPKVIHKSGTVTKGTKIDETTVKESGPDPRYLDAAVRAYADIRAIWGVDTPKKTALTDATGHGTPLSEVVVGNRDEAVEFSRLIEAKASTLPNEEGVPSEVGEKTFPVTE